MSKNMQAGFYTVPEFMRWARIGRTKTYEEIGTGRLRAVKVGRKTLIPCGAAGDWARGNPAFPIYVDVRDMLGVELPDVP